MTALPQIPRGLSPGARALWLWLRLGGDTTNISKAAEALDTGRQSIYRWLAEIGKASQSETNGTQKVSQTSQSDTVGTTGTVGAKKHTTTPNSPPPPKGGVSPQGGTPPASKAKKRRKRENDAAVEASIAELSARYPAELLSRCRQAAEDAGDTPRAWRKTLRWLETLPHDRGQISIPDFENAAERYLDAPKAAGSAYLRGCVRGVFEDAENPKLKPKPPMRRPSVEYQSTEHLPLDASRFRRPGEGRSRVQG